MSMVLPRARIIILPEQLSKLGNLSLLAGMPVEAFIQPGDHAALSYLVKPLGDQIASTMREE